MAILSVSAIDTIPSVPDMGSNPFVTGLNITVTDDTKFTVSPGAARALTNDFVIEFPTNPLTGPALLTCDISRVGANAAYPKSISSLNLANNTLMGVYLIAKSSGTTSGSTNPIISPAVVVATDDNFLPPGYDVYRRIGYVVVISATGYLMKMTQSGNGNDRTYMANTAVVALNAGSATVATTLDLGANDGIIPSKPNMQVIFGTLIVGNAAGAYGAVYQTGVSGAYNQGGAITPVAGQQLGGEFIAVCGQNNLGHAAVDYRVNNAGTSFSLLVVGFIDSLDASLF